MSPQPLEARLRQRIGHQRAAAGAELEQGEALGLAHLLPEIDDEKADQLAEHLADLGRGGEIPLRAQRIAGAVIMRIRRGHPG